MTTDGTEVLIVVLARNGIGSIERCVDSLLDQHDVQFTILVIDNGSVDKTPQVLGSFGNSIHLVRLKRNIGVARAWNSAVQGSTQPWVAFANQDFYADQYWLRSLLGCGMDTGAWIVGSKLRYEDGRIQHAGGHIRYPRMCGWHSGYRQNDRGQFERRRAVGYVTGAAFLVSRAAFHSLHGFDNRFHPAYYEDVDLCLRARQAGGLVVYEPAATGVHLESTTLGQDTATRWYYYHLNRMRLVAKHQTEAQIASAFALAERKAAHNHREGAEWRGLARAYRAALADSSLSSLHTAIGSL